MNRSDRSSAGSTASIPTSVLVNVVDVAERANLPVDRWLTAAGLGEIQLRSPEARVSFRQAADFLRRAVRAMPDRGLGIEVGSRDMYLSFGVLALAVRSSETLSAAMDVGLELHQTTGSLMDIDVQFLDGISALRALERSPEPVILPFLCEELFCSILVMIRSVLEDTARFRSVSSSVIQLRDMRICTANFSAVRSCSTPTRTGWRYRNACWNVLCRGVTRPRTRWQWRPVATCSTRPSTVTTSCSRWRRCCATACGIRRRCPGSLRA